MEQPQMNIDIKQTTSVSCENKKCKNDTFIPAFKMRKMSALLSPHGKETMIPINVFACNECGHINKAFLPQELIEETNAPL